MKFEEYKKPVLISGLIAGALLSIPLVNLLNFICCLWILVGAVIGVYLTAKDIDRKIEYGEGALIGLLSGLVAAVFCTVTSSIYILLGFNMMRYLPQDIPGIEQYSDMLSTASFGVSFVILMLLSSLILYGAFGALGGVIGTAIFGKKKETRAET